MKRLLPLLTRGRYFTICGRVFRTPREHRGVYREVHRHHPPAVPVPRRQAY